MKQGKKKVEDQRTLSPPSVNGSGAKNEVILEDDSLKELNLRVPRQLRKSKEESQSEQQQYVPQNEETNKTNERDENQSNTETNMRLLSPTELQPPEEISPVKKKSGLLSKKRMSVIDECLDQIRSRRDLIAARLLTGASFELDEDILDSSDATLTRENSAENIPKLPQNDQSQDQQQTSLKDSRKPSPKKQQNTLRANTTGKSQSNNIQIILNEETHLTSSKNSKEDLQIIGGGLQEQAQKIGKEKEISQDQNIAKQPISSEKSENENENKNSIRPTVITVEKLDSVLNGSTSPFSKNLQETTGNTNSNSTKPNNMSPTKANTISKASQMSQSKSIRNTTRAFGQGSKMNSMKSSIYQNLGQGSTSQLFGAGSQSQFKMNSGECFEGFRDRQLAHQLAKMEEEEEKSVVRQLERLTEAMRVDKEAYLQQATQRRVNTKDFFKINTNNNQVSQNNNHNHSNNFSQNINKKIDTNNKLQVDCSTGGGGAAGDGGWLDHSNDVANNNSLTMIIHENKEDDYEDLDVGELLSRFEAEFLMKKDTIDPKLSEFLQGSMKLSSVNISGGGTNQSFSQNVPLTEEEQEKQKKLNELAEKIKYKSFTKLGIVLNKQKKDLKQLDLECLQGIVELSILTEERTKRETERKQMEELQKLEQIKQRRQGLEKKQKNLSSEDDEEEYNRRRLERKGKNNIRFGGDDGEERDGEKILPDDIDQVNLQWSDLAAQHEKLKLQLTSVQNQFEKNKQELTQELLELQNNSKDHLNGDSNSKNIIQSNSKLQTKNIQVTTTSQQQNSKARSIQLLLKQVQLKSFKNSFRRLSFQNAFQKIDLRINDRSEELLMKKEQLYGELTELKESLCQLREINLIAMNERIEELQQEINYLRVQLVNNQHTQAYIKDTYENQVKQKDNYDNSNGNSPEKDHDNSDIFYSPQKINYANNRSTYQTSAENNFVTLDDAVQLANKLNKLKSNNTTIERSIEKMLANRVHMQHFLDQQYGRNQYY